MNILLLANPDSWYHRDLRRAAGDRHRLQVAEHRLLRAHLCDSRSTISLSDSALEETDAVLVRTMETGSLEQIVFRMDVLGQLASAGKVVVNSPRAVEAAVDKYLALAKCQRVGLSIPETLVCQTVDDALDAFDVLGGDIVVKPLFGGEGRGIFRVTDRDAATRCFRMLVQLQAIVYVQRFIQHEGFDLRLLVIGDRVLGMRRINERDWRFNVSRGATTESIELTEGLVEIAQRASTAIGAEVAGVDVLPGRDGRLYLLEVNAVPGWKALARTLNVDVAALVLSHLESRVRGAGAPH
jgi:RimK family alpha-L-glutamate ligase